MVGMRGYMLRTYLDYSRASEETPLYVGVNPVIRFRKLAGPARGKILYGMMTQRGGDKRLHYPDVEDHF